MANNNYIDNIKIENARIVFRNFAGKPDKFNPKGGKRSFSVVITDHDFAKNLIREGWNLKQFKASEDQEGEPDYYIQTKVSFDNNPPHIYLIAGKKKTVLTEETVASLDYAEISSVDVVITPYHYSTPDREGIAAYCKTLYVNVIVDDFASKYEFDDEEDIPFN